MITNSRVERRNLTVLFADVVGSSSLATQLDVEDLQIVLRSVQDCFRQAIGHYDGQIARYLGDGVLAYFGFPVAYEDAAERAVNAALEMRASVAGLSLPYLSSQLQLHVGIATGLVLVGDLIGAGPNREVELIGEAPNFAAWLQQYAKPGQVLISPNTRGLLHELFELADLGECRVKGYEDPLRVWNVIKRRTFQSRFDAHRSSQLTPFVGRDPELDILLVEFVTAKRTGGRTVAICGEGGIGKSRLIDTFCEKLERATYRRVLLQCSSHHTFSPLYPVIRYLEDAADIHPEDLLPIKFQKLEGFLASELAMPRKEAISLIAGLLSIATPSSYPQLELTPQQQKRRTLSVLLELFQAQSHLPLVLIFEDIHWIDPSSLELLDLIRDEAKKSPILTIVSFRPEFDAQWVKAVGERLVTVRPLEPEYAELVVTELCGDRVLPSVLKQRVLERSDGVPLFIEEVTKTILLDVTDVAGPERSRVVPSTLHDSLMARIDRLADLRVIAQIGAAIGREFRLSLLEAVAPFSADEIQFAISKLMEAGLIFQQQDGVAGVFVFKHALIQEAAYTSMLRSERQKLHTRIAEVLCAKFPEVAVSSPETVARHYTEAREYRWAATFWLKAGQAAFKSSAFIEGGVHFQAGLQSLSAMPETEDHDRLELQLQQSLASACIATKGFGAAETFQAFERALEVAIKIGDIPQVCLVLNGLASVHYMRGNFEEACALSRDLLDRALQQNDNTAVLLGRRILGISLFAMGELQEARSHLEHVLEMYDQQRHAPLVLAFPFAQDLKATAQVYLGLTLALLDRIDDGLSHGRKALAYAEELRHPHSICYVLAFLAGLHVISGRPEEAVLLAERTINLSAEHGFPQWRAGGLLLRGWSAIDLGQIESGIGDIRASIDELQATGTLVWMQFAEFLLARALMLSGEMSAASELVDQVLGELRTAGGRWYEAEVLYLKGDVIRATGKSLKEAESFYRAAMAVAARQGARLWELRASTAVTSCMQKDVNQTQLVQ